MIFGVIVEWTYDENLFSEWVTERDAKYRSQIFTTDCREDANQVRAEMRLRNDRHSYSHHPESRVYVKSYEPSSPMMHVACALDLSGLGGWFR